MSKRKSNLQNECFSSFTKALKKEIRENLKLHKRLDRKAAKARAAAYSNVIFLLKEKALEHGLELSELGIEDFEVPSIDDDFEI